MNQPRFLASLLACVAVVCALVWLASRPRPKVTLEREQPALLSTAQTLPASTAERTKLDDTTSAPPNARIAAATSGTNQPAIPPRTWAWLETPSQRWERRPSEPTFEAFGSWARRWAAADAVERVALETEGVELAAERRAELAGLMQSDPQRALELMVPDGVRRQLPEAIAALIEKPVSGRGDLAVMAAFPEEGKAPVRPANSRYATLGGRTYEAFVYGRRLGHPTRWNIPMHGFALDGRVALSESPVRVLEAEAVASAKAALPSDPVCSVSGLSSTVNREEVVLDTGEDAYTFQCSPEHAARLAASLAAAEDAQPPRGGDSGITPNYAHTGARKILLIRVDFSDYTSDPFTATEGSNILNTLSTTFSNWSYGRLITARAGEGSDVTPVYRMPTSNADYNGNDGQLRTDARNAAAADGYNLNDYDLDAVCFHGGTSGWGYGGLAYVGARGSWLHTTGESSTANVASHEFGHNFGLNHASFYNAPFGTVNLPGGSSEEYGNPWDSMGAASVNNAFGASQKEYLGWITNGPAGNEWVGVSSGSTTNRLYAHDEVQAPGLLKGIRVTRDAALNNDKEFYWIEYRTTKANKALDNGVVLNWAGDGNEKPNLLDTTPGSSPSSSSDKDDSALVIGRTFTDTNYNIHITPIGKGVATQSWIDVVVRYGAFSGNSNPVVDVSASASNASTGVSISFTATASDPDGDTLAYSWDYDDGDYSTSNNPNVSHSWSSAGEYVVQCTVSDMKGGIARQSVVVRIGNPTVYRVSGQVLYHGVPVPGVRVYTDSTNFTWSDSDGFYNLTGLRATNYNVSAFLEGHNIVRNGFTNPVSLGPNAAGINFLAGTPLMGGLVNRTVNWNTTNSPLLFWAYDHETPNNQVALAVTNNNTNLVPANGYSLVNSGTNRILTIRVATNVAGTVTNFVVATDTNGFGVTNTFTLAINGPPTLTTTTVTTNEDSSVDVDLWARTADSNPAGTADSNILFSVAGAVNGGVTLVSNRYARFQPAANYFGPASFQFTATDKGYDPALLLYYDFEPTDSPSDNTASDRSGNARNGTLDRDNSGAFDYVTNDVPPALAGFNLVSLQLSDNGNTNSARLYRRIVSTEYSFNNTNWTFACWFRRDTSTNDDTLFHLGGGDGGGGNAHELELILLSGSQRLRVRHYDTNGALDLDLFSAVNVATGAWNHVAVTYTRTNTNKGDFRLYHNGALAGTSNAITLGMSVTNVVFGGHDHTNNTHRWFNGSLDEVALWKRALTSNEIAGLQTEIVAHFGGLSRTTNINLTFNAVNDPPTISSVGNYQIPEDTFTGNIPFTIGDVDNDSSTLVVTGASSDTNLVPNATNHIILGGGGASRTFKLVPATNANGVTTITLAVSDGVALTNRAFTFTVTPVNDPPVLLTQVAKMVHAGDTLNFTLTATDIDSLSSAFSFALINPPGGASVHSGSGLVTWSTGESDEGNRTLTARVSDNGAPNLSGTNTYSVIILPKPTVGTLAADSATITISWESIPGRTYRVRFKNDLAEALWQDLPGDVTASGTTASKEDTLSGLTQRFYQVILVP